MKYVIQKTSVNYWDTINTYLKGKTNNAVCQLLMIDVVIQPPSYIFMDDDFSNFHHFLTNYFDMPQNVFV